MILIMDKLKAGIFAWMQFTEQRIARFKVKKYADINLIIDERTRKWKD